jgi:hypothetical protein
LLNERYKNNQLEKLVKKYEKTWEKLPKLKLLLIIKGVSRIYARRL